MSKNKKIYIDYSVIFLIIVLSLFGFMFYDYTIVQPKIHHNLIELTNEYNRLNKYIENRLHHVNKIKTKQNIIIDQEKILIKQLNIIIKDSI